MRVGIAGLGLIGASLGLSLRRAGFEVTGFEPQGGHRSAALQRGAVASCQPDSIGLARACDLLVLAAPPLANIELLELLSGAGLPASLLITDTGSVKRTIALRAAELLKEGGPQFVPGHPMAGGASRGPDQARADLFEGAAWYVCCREIPRPMLEVIRAAGAEPVAVDANEHDEWMARLSHAPQLAAWAFAAGWKRSGADPGRGGPVARELARIAASDPGLWVEIAMENRAPILTAIQELIDELVVVRDELEREDAPGLRRLWKARQE